MLGFDLHGKTAAVVGTGKIGAVVARILAGFGCRLLAYDLYPSDECRAFGTDYVGLPELLAVSDLVTLHVPLTPESYHLIDERAVARMKRGMMLINTGRGALLDTRGDQRAEVEADRLPRPGRHKRRRKGASSKTSPTACCTTMCSHDS